MIISLHQKRRTRKLVRCAGYGIVLLGLQACLAPAEHTNPLDPQSPLYTSTGSISGQVTSFYQPFQPLVGATVQLLPPGLSRQTGTNGVFRFTDLEPDTYTLIASAAGYAVDSVRVTVARRRETVHQFHLNGLPIVQEARITSANVATREATSNRLFLEVNASITDPDGAGDILRVSVMLPEFGFADTLGRESAAGVWRRLFLPEEIELLDPLKLVGTPVFLDITDAPGAQIRSAPFFLARIVTDIPVALSPANAQVIHDNSPTFRWQLPSLSFSFSQRLEIFRLDAGFPAFVTAISRIGSDIRNLTFIGRLSSGTYFWTIAVIDDFGNSSRSKEATFQIQ